MPEPKKPKEVKLKVAEAIQDDVNKGIVRIDSTFMKSIGIKPGDIIEIEGERKSVAIADRAYPGDIGLNIIRMDGIQRRNCRSGIGELISVRMADAKEARKVTIAPARKGVFIKASPSIFKQGLLGRAIVKGDIISLGGASERRTSLSHSPFFDDIFDVLDENLMGFGFSGLKFVVVDSQPKQPVVITESTEVIFNPEAVELVEEEAVPEVSYEDVGGLQEEIKKVREMVELPLKHPEIFERLGIEPPKGVLLHGPPGTGKTLLAKAVANETNSHFILINGPEIMCVDGDTKILTNPKGYRKAKDIFHKAKLSGKVQGKSQEVVTLKKPISTYAINKQGKIVKANITHTTKLKAPSYEVILSDGNKVTTSHNQPFLTYENGKRVWKKLQDLKEGDYVSKINNLAIKEKSHKINLTIEGLVKKADRYCLKSRNLSRSNWISLPAQTNPELMEFLGLVMSDGHIDKREESICFANDDKALRERFKKLTKSIFSINKFKEYKDGRVFFYSKLAAQYITLLGIQSGAKESNIPSYMYSLPKKEIQSFVKGYFDGDGCVANTPFTNKSGEKKNYPTPIIYCKSREFLQEFQSILQLRLSISTKLLEHKTLKGMMHKLVVRGYDGRKKFIEIGSSSTKKGKLRRILRNIKEKEYENIPTPQTLLKAIRSLPYATYRNNDYYIYGKGRFTRYTLQKLFTLAKNHNVVTTAVQKEYDCLMKNHVGWERILNIEYVGERELYDFTVDKDNFTASPYLLLHNSKYYGQSEENLRKRFEEAEKNAPAIVFIDEIDAIASKREEAQGEVERRVVAQLLALMDGLNARGKVVVIAASNIPNALDPALRRPGRFDREIEIGVPGKEGRLNILKIHTRNMPLKTKSNLKENEQKEQIVNLNEIARITHGFVGADLSALAKEAAMIVLRRLLPELKLKEEEPIPKQTLEKLFISQKDIKDALKVVRPSALREVLIEIPNIKWDKIGGLEEIKQDLREAVEWPLKHPEYFKRLGIRPPRGILIYGAPGTGKTLLAKAVANESDANFISVKGAELLSKWVGESEKAVRKIFQKARQTSPTIIFFDEIDAIAPRRGVSSDSQVTERVVNQLLTEMDGLQELGEVIIIGATNRPDILDTALLRPGRFDRIIQAPAPDTLSRMEILKIHTKNMPIKIDEKSLNIELNISNPQKTKKSTQKNILSKMAGDEPVPSDAVSDNAEEKDSPHSKDLNDEEIKKLDPLDKFLYIIAKEAEGYAGADIEALCREAAMLALRKDDKAKEVSISNFKEAMNKVRPSITKEVKETYDQLKGQFSSAQAKLMKEESPNYFG